MGDCAIAATSQKLGKKVMVLIWDNAPWHCSKRIRGWIHTYNQQAKQVGEVRLLVHWLPIKNPWLNPIEPYWRPAKQRVCEPQVNYQSRNYDGGFALNSML